MAPKGAEDKNESECYWFVPPVLCKVLGFNLSFLRCLDSNQSIIAETSLSFLASARISIFFLDLLVVLRLLVASLTGDSLSMKARRLLSTDLSFSFDWFEKYFLDIGDSLKFWFSLLVFWIV